MVITRRATDEIRDIEHHGNVIAARSWGAELEELRVPPAPPGTHESLLHSNAIRRCSSSLTTVFPDDRDSVWLSTPRRHRAIGVVYDPDTEHHGNWVPTVMGQRYDAFIYLDETRPLQPLAVLPRMDGMAKTDPGGR